MTNWNKVKEGNYIRHIETGRKFKVFRYPLGLGISMKAFWGITSGQKYIDLHQLVADKFELVEEK